MSKARSATAAQLDDCGSEASGVYGTWLSLRPASACFLISSCCERCEPFQSHSAQSQVRSIYTRCTSLLRRAIRLYMQNSARPLRVGGVSYSSVTVHIIHSVFVHHTLLLRHTLQSVKLVKVAKLLPAFPRDPHIDDDVALPDARVNDVIPRVSCQN